VSAAFRKGWLALGWLWVAAILWLSLTPVPPQPFTFSFSDKVEHMLAYLFLMGWFAVVCRGSTRRLVAVLLVSMGIGVEILQGLSGYRYFEWADMAANTTGVLLAWLAMDRAGDACLEKMGWK
jgi:VanZ family protein